MRVMTLAHAHAGLLAGGGERAALSLHQWWREEAGVEPVLVARAEPADVGHSAPFAAFRGRPDEILANLPGQDQFSLDSMNYTLVERMIDALLARFRPDIVHVQHFARWSLDALTVLAARGVPVMMTLHEFLMICHNDGQMVKTWGGLCHAESPAECARCFPKHSAGEFFLRKAIIQQRLASVRHFVSPSRFLAERYVAWGLPAEKVSVIENALAPDLLAEEATEPVRGERVRFGFFGQLNQYKGADVLLEAVGHLAPEVRERVSIGLHGANLQYATERFQERFAALLAVTEDVAASHGRYANDAVLGLMAGYDWIVVPSIWWENSPVVIQEARLARRPVLASAIGGMAEKVGAGGATFRPGDARDLAARMAAIVVGELAVTVDPGAIVAEQRQSVAAHLSLFRDILAAG